MNTSEIQSIKQRFGIIGNSPVLNHAIEVAAQVAPTDMTVLISGESGSGKESFSKIIHHLSHRKHGKFIAINCGAIPEGTIDSELFGHEKGSFTGAHESRRGYFEVTNSGTIFLDEIAELPNATQARLLRVLEYGEFIKVGSSKVLKTDVRVVTATNVNLAERVQKGKFRQDLFYRLNTVPIFVPPLRDRGQDIELLFRKFAADFADRYKVKPIVLTKNAISLLLNYRFPGNIRQLKNIAEQISVLEMSREIDENTLLKYLPTKQSYLPALYHGQSDSKDEGLSERELLYKILFDMRQDVNEMKKLVHVMISEGVIDRSTIEKHTSLFDPSSPKHNTAYEDNTLIVKPKTPMTSPYDIDGIQDISHETEHDESLSIEAKEKELIIKALRKNNNKRKYAAQDLGISERTLYRKIKQYQIEE